MTRVGFIADVHVANHRWRGGPLRAGVNARARLIVETLHGACAKAEALGCEALVVCGDLFDNPHPEPQLVRAVGDAFWQFIARGRVDKRVFVLTGNHDMATDEELDHAVASLGLTSGIVVVDRPRVECVGDAVLWLVPYRSGNTREWLPGVLRELDDYCRDGSNGVAENMNFVLALHAGISDASTPEFLVGSHDSVEAKVLGKMMEDNGIIIAVAGNWHSHASWGGPSDRQIVQCGALVPTGFDNPGLDGYGSLIVVEDSLAWTRHEIPGPRFLTVSGDMAMEAYRDAAAHVSPGQLFVRWKAAVGQLGACAATLKNDELMLGLAGGEVVPEQKSYEAAVGRASAAAAVSGASWQEALRAYVDAMPLDQRVGPEAVYARALQYLTR